MRLHVSVCACVRACVYECAGVSPEVYGLAGEQAVGVGGGVAQRQRRGGRGLVLAEGVRGERGAQARLAVRPAHPHPRHAHRLRRLALQDQLQLTLI